MDPDKYQRAWRAQASQTRVTIDADLLLKKVQRSQQDLRAAKFFGDFGVIGILLLLLPAWIYMGVTSASPWTWYLMVPAILWIIGFILVGRARQKRRPSESGEPLLKSVKESLALVEHQIWLSRNNLWWYLLPMLIPMLIFFAHVAWEFGIETNEWLAALAFGTFLFIFASAVFAFVYYVIQRSLRKHYEPRRQELLALLCSLSDETPSAGSDAYPILMSEKRVACTPRRMWVGYLLFLAIMLLVIAGILMVFHLAAPVYDQTAGAADEKQTTNPPIDNVVQKVNAAQDEELYRQLTPEFQKAISLASFRNVLQSVRGRSGRLLTWTEQESAGETRVYRVQGEKGSSIVKIALDKEGKISGLRFTPVSSWGTFDVPRWFRIFLVFASPYVIRRLLDRRRVREVGKMRQLLGALFGAVVCPLIFIPVTPTLGRVAALAVLGAACALMVGNNEALKLRLSRKRLQILWASFGAVFGTVLGLVLLPGTPTLDLVAVWQELVAFCHDPDGSVTPTLDFVTLPVLGAALALFFGNAKALAERVGIGLGSVLLSILFRCLGLHRGYPDYAGAARSDGPSGAWLAGLVSKLRKRKKLVGLAARVMIDGQIMASAADGERKRGSGVPIELGDRWHLGSITKSITATMIARLIESGQMQWSDSVGERFPDTSIHEDWKPVTLRQLLTHTAGAPANFSLPVRRIRPALGPECTKERRKAVLDVLARKPVRRPGKMYAYSNVGYTIAGAMAEAVTGVSWEDLVKREVFEPLELTGAGFGPPKSPSQTLDQPRGHRGMLDWKTSASDEEDNTPIMGPAGTVHMTLSDLCTYATEHLRGEPGTGKLLAAETYKRLHTPELDNYACGWVKRDPTYEAPYTAYWHNGSNTMWYALVVFIPDKNMTVAVTANDGDMVQAESAAWAVVEASVNQFNAEGEFAPRKSPAPGN